MGTGQDGTSVVAESSTQSVRFLGESRVRDDQLLSPGDAAQQKSARRRRLYTLHVPLMRVFGMALLSAAVFVYNRHFPESGSDGQSLDFLLVAMAYAVGVWPLLSLTWPKWHGIERTLLLTDIVLFVGAIYATGGERSWMLPMLLMRSADQSPYGLRRTFYFSVATVLAYLGMVTWLDFVEGRAIDWSVEWAKALLLFMAGCYVALTARGYDIQRKRIHHAIATSRELSQRLARARDEALSADRAKSRFLANMSHEIRTPLAAVVGISDLLIAGDLTREQAERVDMLRSSATSLLSVIDDVLDFSKIESGHLELHPTDLVLADLVSDVFRLFEPRARDVGTELVADIEEGLDLYADAGRLRQILVNLVGNALKFTSEGTVRVKAWKKPGAGSEGPASEDLLVIKVNDTGAGIDPQALESVFQAFTQVDDTAARHHGGVGLGLAICRTLAETMGGRIEVLSGDLGTTFRLELPFLPARGPIPPGSGEKEAFVKLRGNVLLVEDEPVNRLVSGQVLSALGLRVTEATNGEEALAKLDEAAFDLVLMDCQMPILDGYAAAERIRHLESERDDGQRIPIVALTAHAFEDDRNRCLASGMDGYLTKPVRLDSLGRQLSRWLKPV